LAFKSTVDDPEGHWQPVRRLS